VRRTLIELWEGYVPLEKRAKNHKTLNPEGVLQKKTYQYIVGFFEKHISVTTNSIHVLLKNGLTYNECDHDMDMLSQN